MNALNPLESGLIPWNRGWNFIPCKGNDVLIRVLNHITQKGVSNNDIKIVNKSLHRTDVFYLVRS